MGDFDNVRFHHEKLHERTPTDIKLADFNDSALQVQSFLSKDDGLQTTTLFVLSEFHVEIDRLLSNASCIK